MATRVRITDVSPRDGLQNEPGVIPAAEKAELIVRLCATGVDEVEVGSFVSPKWIPQLGDTAEVAAILRRRSSELGAERPLFSYLVPNERGMSEAERIGAAAPGVDKVAVFTAASETFCRRNINATIAESIERFRPVVERARRMPGGPISVRGYISCVIACPFEGAIEAQRVADVARMLIEAGVDEIDLGDTIGAGTPDSVRRLLSAVLDAIGEEWLGVRRGSERGLTLHLHDTFGRAAECVRAALDMGVRSFDGSVAGLGGCPYAGTPEKRAPGNISTELLVRTVQDAGYKTGVHLDRLAEAAEYAREIVGRARRIA